MQAQLEVLAQLEALVLPALVPLVHLPLLEAQAQEAPQALEEALVLEAPAQEALVQEEAQAQEAPQALEEALVEALAQEAQAEALVQESQPPLLFLLLTTLAL